MTLFKQRLGRAIGYVEQDSSSDSIHRCRKHFFTGFLRDTDAAFQYIRRDYDKGIYRNACNGTWVCVGHTADPGSTAQSCPLPIFCIKNSDFMALFT